jgi:predicted TIM-barrel fold metal-dependent hydrolase
MGSQGFYVIDADGHGGEPLDWRSRIPDAHRPTAEAFVAKMKDWYGRKGLPGGGLQLPEEAGTAIHAQSGDPLRFEPDTMRAGMSRPAARIEDMDLEGIDVTVMFSGGAGEEWAMLDADFAVALCRTLNDARAEFAQFAPDRLKHVAKLPMHWPTAAAEELERCVENHPGTFVAMSTTQHVRDRNLDDPAFDVVWSTAARLDVAVCTHGGGSAPDQVPIAIDRFPTSEVARHALTHPLGGMLSVMAFTVGGILHRFPSLRVGIMEAGSGWLPFWLQRLDEEWERMPEQAPAIDRQPSEYFHGRCWTTAEPDDLTVPWVMRELDPTTVCFASDYCHWDCEFPNSVKLWVERDDLSDDDKRRILTDNPSRLYALPVPAGNGSR